MPEICRFYGISIAMFYDDHAPPHIHARYAEHRARFDISSGATMGEYFPARAERLVKEWIALHQEELMRAWRSRTEGLPLPTIAPLA
jgi:hypothetical protein